MLEKTQMPKRKTHTKTIIVAAVIVSLIVLLAVFVSSPIFSNLKQAVTGKAVSGEDVLEAFGQSNSIDGSATGDVEKSLINTRIDMLTQEFGLPINNLDVTIKAKQVDILSPDADISLTLSEPMELQAFNGNLEWKNSMLTLSGQLDKHLSDEVKINWKATDNIQIHVMQGTVKVSQLSIEEFNSVVSGEIVIWEKVTLNPEKDIVTIKNFRGTFTTEVGEDQARLILDGHLDKLFLGSQEFNLNIE